MIDCGQRQRVAAAVRREPGTAIDPHQRDHEGGFPLDRLKMELTESAFMRNPEWRVA